MLIIINHTLRRLGLDEKGASAVEYAILVGIIGATLATGAQLFATDLSNVFRDLMSHVNLGTSASA
ncbi:MAG: Flp/Fap pilin component [Sphingomonadales bacterium]|nr:Flp/Fap pilin component [Sphingomonadales bacterium]